jgi:hypothetical protein
LSLQQVQLVPLGSQVQLVLLELEPQPAVQALLLELPVWQEQLGLELVQRFPLQVPPSALPS